MARNDEARMAGADCEEKLRTPRQEFMETFDRSCVLRLDEEGEKELERIFDRTVRHALCVLGADWESRRKFNLRRVREIAIAAQGHAMVAGRPRVSGKHLKDAADLVIGFWKPICKQKITAARAGLRVSAVPPGLAPKLKFCEGYPLPVRRASEQAGSNRGDLTDPYDIAHYDFHERFGLSCSLALLTPEAADQLGWIFERTVGAAIENGTVDWIKNDELREFALDRVQEIAELAASGVCDDQVSLPVLTMAAEKVIYYWKRVCDLRLKQGGGEPRLRFCEGYPD